MAESNHERVGKVMDLLKQGLDPYVNRRLQSAVGPGWASSYAGPTGAPRPLVTGGRKPTGAEVAAAGKAKASVDVLGLLKAMRDHWGGGFSEELGSIHKSVCHELIDWRHAWAHQKEMSTEDVLRVMDSAKRLLEGISAGELSEQIEQMRRQLVALQTKEQSRGEYKKVQPLLLKTDTVPSALVPWRQLMTPREDVREGTFNLAGFAADLWEVHRGTALPEYGDPVEFFGRTYLTGGMRDLLRSALERLTGKGGDPVIQLQTNFGGGKTHSMLALYHLTSGIDPAKLPGVEQALLEPSDIRKLPSIKRAVFVGTQRGPAEVVTPEPGVTIHTLWGELAYQLGGKAAWQKVAEADKRAVNPGEAFREVLIAAAPCVILIDEWVAYARQLFSKEPLPAGTFDVQFTFAQALTEAVKATPGALLLVSVPESDMEVGGHAGREALESLRRAVGRLETSWRPADMGESFEIVRRRLFEELAPEDLPKRNAVCRAFTDWYRKYPADFPASCREKPYQDELEAAYPIHPELFQRLYTDWSTIDKFQRTRGVLRLMATVVHALWRGQDSHLLIMPGTIPIESPEVQNELTRYLEENWRPVLDEEVVGEKSHAGQMQVGNTTFQKLGATYKVARTVFLGSAPLKQTANPDRGQEDIRIKLGSVQPGEVPAHFSDALRQLADSGVYLYTSQSRYWYGLRANVNRRATELADRYKEEPHKVWEELQKRLEGLAKNRCGFSKVHARVAGPEDVIEAPETRLVILPPEFTYDSGEKDLSKIPALELARKILDQRPGGPRMYRNALVFLAVSKRELAGLEDRTRSFLAWQTIVEEIKDDQLVLDAQQKKQATENLANADAATLRALMGAYGFVLYPSQAAQPGSPLTWNKLPLKSGDPIKDAYDQLVHADVLLPALGPVILRKILDDPIAPLWDAQQDHVSIRKLGEYFAVHLYLSKLLTPEVLVRAIEDGLAGREMKGGLPGMNAETFAYAESFDSTTGRYLGLVEGRAPMLHAGSPGLLVKPAAARRQLDAERPQPVVAVGESATTSSSAETGSEGPATGTTTTAPPPTLERELPTRFQGSVALDPTRIPLQAAKVAEEVIAHLEKLVGSQVVVSLEIQAVYPAGFNDDVQRVVSENSRTLKFAPHSGFEKA